MRVVHATRFGGPEVLATIQAADPVAGPGQVVIGVSVADVLFVDTQIRRGLHRGYFTVKPPYVPGAGAAGEVIAIGDGVDPGWLGRRVVASARVGRLCRAGLGPGRRADPGAGRAGPARGGSAPL